MLRPIDLFIDLHIELIEYHGEHHEEHYVKSYEWDQIDDANVYDLYKEPVILKYS